jgi:phosphoribosylanthranilate isomerase
MQIAKLFFLFDIWPMSLKTTVKVGSITSLSEARYCAGMGVDLLGFPVGDGGLKPEQYRQMIEWVAGPELVLEVTHSRTLDLQYITDNYPGHYIGIGRAQLDWLSNTKLNFILTIEPSDWVSLYGDLMGRENLKYIELLGATKNDVASVRAISSQFPVLLNIAAADALDEGLMMNTKGISLTGSDEEKPGMKDYGHVAEVLEALETE